VEKESLLCSYRFLFELDSCQVVKSFQGLAKYLNRSQTEPRVGMLKNLAEVVNNLQETGVLQHWLGRYSYFIIYFLI
jgi:hypothetical protein